jgi:hypothetical protein
MKEETLLIDERLDYLKEFSSRNSEQLARDFIIYLKRNSEYSDLLPSLRSDLKSYNILFTILNVKFSELNTDEIYTKEIYGLDLSFKEYSFYFSVLYNETIKRLLENIQGGELFFGSTPGIKKSKMPLRLQMPPSFTINV